MKTFSFYNNVTGQIIDHHLTCTEENLSCNTPAGHTAIEGHHDYLSRMVDLTTKKVIDYIPPQPGQFHIWNEKDRRWQYVKQPSDYAEEVKLTRNRLLAESDWVVTKAAETNTPVPINWLEYRGKLRDITEQEGFPLTITWPVLEGE